MDERCNIFCYTLQLCNSVEKTNTQNGVPYVPFTEVNKETFGENFYPPDLIGSNPDKKLSVRKAFRNIARMMCNENKPKIIANLENVPKHLPSDMEFTVCDEKHNDFTYSRLILD